MGTIFRKIKHTTTIANGTREKPFPNLSTILLSVPFLSTKQSTRTAIPTPDSTANWYISTSMENKIRYIHHLKYDLTKIEKIPKKVKSFASYPNETCEDKREKCNIIFTPHAIAKPLPIDIPLQIRGLPIL